MYKNSEGLSDPTAGQALSNISWEQLQQDREKEHGLKRGQEIEVHILEQTEERGKKWKIKKYRVIELYKHCVLLEDGNGMRTAPPYSKLRSMMQG